MNQKQKMVSAGITGVGFYLPDEIRTNDWFDGVEELASLDKEIFDHAGVRERRICSKNDSGSDLECRALLRAVEDAGIDILDVDFILDSPGINDQISPGNASALQYKSGAKNAAGLTVDNHCASFIYEIGIAKALICTGKYKTVACVSSTIWSRIADYSEKSCLFIGDGATAVVLQEVEDGFGVLDFSVETVGEFHESAGINVRLPKSLVKKYEPSHLFEPPRERPYFFIESGPTVDYMKKIGPNRMKEVAEKAVNGAGYKLTDLDFLVSSNTAKGLLEKWREGLGIPEEQHYTTMEKYGHVGPASLGINLCEAVAHGWIKEGDLVAMMAAGVGFHHGALVMRWGRGLEN